MTEKEVPRQQRKEVFTKVIRLLPNDWTKYRDIRLLALQSDPHAFGSSFEEESGLSETDWRNRNTSMWFAENDGDIVGLIGLLRCENLASKHCGFMVALWVKPQYRNQGIASTLVERLKDAEAEPGIRKISLHVSETQQAAKRLYEKLGFKEVGLVKANLFKDGKYLDEYLMEWLAS